MIESQGGVILSKAQHPHRDHCIRLVCPNETVIKRDQDLFEYDYILECIKIKNIVTNLNEFRVGHDKVPSVFKPYDPLDVLMGNVKWKDLEKADNVGERVSDIEDDDQEFPINQKPHNFKANRMPYSKNEQQEIVDWIIKNGAFLEVKGNQIWKKMEGENVGRGRTYQSLKEHFRKTVISQIHTFNLSEEIVDNFKVGMGLKQDDLVGVRLNLLKDQKKVTNESPKKRDVNSSVETVGLEINEDVTDDDEEHCYHCQPVQGITRLEKHKKVCFDCSRPSRSQSTSLFNLHDPSRKSLDSLLDKSSLDESDDDRSSKSTEPQNEEPLKWIPLNLPKKRKKLFSQQVLNSPADPITPLVKKKKKEALDNLQLPLSTQTFNTGLLEAAGRSSADTDDGAGLTSTQIPNTIEDDDSEVFLSSSSPRKPPLSKGKACLKEDVPEKTKNNVKDYSELIKRVDVKLVKLSKEKIEEYQTNGFQSADELIETIFEKNVRKTCSKQKQASNKNDEEVQSQNLLDRFLEDQTKFGSDSQIQTEDLVDALNNDSPESFDDGEISFASPPSPVRRRDNVFKVPTSPPTASNLNDTYASSTATVKSGRFFNEGVYRENFRLPYTPQEEKAILNFFLEEGGYQLRRGKSIWIKMENKRICSNRTWQSIKGRWDKFLSRNLATYNLSEEDLIAADVKVFGHSKDEEAGDDDERQSLRGHRAGIKFYTEEEDLKLIHHLLENRRYHDVKGREMWQVSHLID